MPRRSQDHLAPGDHDCPLSVPVQLTFHAFDKLVAEPSRQAVVPRDPAQPLSAENAAVVQAVEHGATLGRLWRSTRDPQLYADALLRLAAA